MNTQYNQIQSNKNKTYLLMGSFGLIFITLGYIFSYVYENQAILYGAVIFSVLSNFFSYFFSDKVALKASGARRANAKNPADARAIRIVENLAIASGMKTPKVYIIDDRAMNAFATGRNQENASIAFTSGIIEVLDKSELEGVAAHEMSHIKNRDIMVMTIVVTLVGVLALVSDMFMRGAFHGRKNSGLYGRNSSGDNKANSVILIIGITAAIVSPLIAKLIQLSISRKREYLADASGALMTRYPEGLASALEKIHKYSPAVKRAGTATAHLYIASPFGDGTKTKVNFLERIFSTHPPMEERVRILRSMNF
jgi:heat shock protein HtpX